MLVNNVPNQVFHSGYSKIWALNVIIAATAYSHPRPLTAQPDKPLVAFVHVPDRNAEELTMWPLIEKRFILVFAAIDNIRDDSEIKAG